jgi:glucan phosphoethanolaminetransferase (alkaline phosphatase superfamily)
MTDFQGFIFLIVLILIIVGIVILKFIYDIWATSVTLKLLKNNSGKLSYEFSYSKVIAWLVIVGLIAVFLGFLSKRQQPSPQSS